MLLFLLLPLVISFASTLPQDDFHEQLVTYLRPNELYMQEAPTLIQTIYTQNRVHIFCQRAQPRGISNLFQSKYILLEIAQDADYKQYKDRTARGVYQSHRLRLEVYDAKLLAGAGESHLISMPAHMGFCYGIYTADAFNLTLLEVRYDEERLLMLGLGLALYGAAPILEHTRWVFYGTGAALGVFLARLGVVCFALLFTKDAQLKDLMKLMPLQDNFKLMIAQQPSFVTISLMFGALIMRDCCQRFSRLWLYPRVRYAHRCVLRLLAYYFLYFASDNARFGCLCVCALVPWPELWWLLCWLKLKLVMHVRCMYPPMPRRLLSREEFNAQTLYETQCALNDLRERARLERPTWQQAALLQEPLQFARFIDGESDLLEPSNLTQRYSNTFISSTHSNSNNAAMGGRQEGIEQATTAVQTMPQSSQVARNTPFTGQDPAGTHDRSDWQYNATTALGTNGVTPPSSNIRTLYQNTRFLAPNPTRNLTGQRDHK